MGPNDWQSYALTPMHDDTSVARLPSAECASLNPNLHLFLDLHLTSHLCQLDGSINTEKRLSCDPRTSSIMRLLQYTDNGDFSLTEFFESDIPKYAILSHRWGAEEVTFADLINSTGKSKAGYSKIRFCGEQAKCNGLQYFWVDTCCINKSNSTELAEAINSTLR
jgi:hypothetical protein